MPRVFPNSSITDMNAVSTTEGWLILLEFTFDVPPILYIVNNNVDITSNGQVYTAYAFNIILENQDGDNLPRVQLTIDNVDRALIEEMRSLQDSPSIIIKMVPISDLDTPEITIPNMTLREVTYDKFSITGTLFFGDALNQRFPKERYTPENVPGLF